MEETVERWCPFCESETVQTAEYSRHERDSSYDSYQCLCGALYLGMTGKYAKYINNVYVAKE